MRRPHRDDVGRLEQTLRDLERGAFIAYASYNDRTTPDQEEHDDPVTTGWVKGEHDDARRLIKHARKQYETHLRVRTSRRPWAAPDAADFRTAEGYLWHADFFLRERTVDIPGLWRDIEGSGIEGLLVHLEVSYPYHVGFCFSTADDGAEVADAIGSAFEYVLTNPSFATRADLEAQHDHARRVREIDYRIVADDGWTNIADTTVPISIFGAGGAVTSAPRW